MILTIQPVRAEGRILVPVGDYWRMESDYLHVGRAVVEECRERHWEISPRSQTLARRVSTDSVAPKYVVKSEGGVMLAIWVGVA